eukprot:CAMPEP_0174271404 /NCGR_PEP_ID=MMETSP0439-20130205/47771_1 /TAXON_ID=0 /ORGANISM="Stereomyxa ramosa, Strain Chinc5" /LENGTH=327 /DNA_ID=CAMNT_0015361383 /DNA_START=1410 /DNA_END=2390 /DNA_ORIENTATION=+
MEQTQENPTEDKILHNIQYPENDQDLDTTLNHFNEVRVLYHSPCPDGAFSALAAYLYYKHLPNINIEYYPHSTYEEFVLEENTNITTNSDVYLVDYIGKENFILDLAKKVKRVTLLDHHKTSFDRISEWLATNQIPDNLRIHLEYSKSGATVCRYHFLNKAHKKPLFDPENEEKLNTLYDYIEDNDLWRRSLENSKEFSVGIREKGIHYDIKQNPSLFLQLLQLDAEKLIALGKKHMSQEQALIDRDLANSFQVDIKDSNKDFGSFLGVKTRNQSLRSEMGHQLAVKSAASGLRGIGAICYEQEGSEDNTYKVSLRSLVEEDTTTIS